jgi:tetratricopeptide (TPR) repeat protein
LCEGRILVPTSQRGFLAGLALFALMGFASGQATAAQEEGETPPTQSLAALDAALAERPDDLGALAERARLHEATGRPMQAFLDRREILRLRPDDAGVARLAAYNLMAAGAPGAAAELIARHPAAVSDEAGEDLARLLEGDLAARRIRWGWAEPVFDPGERRHEAEAAIAALERARRRAPDDQRAADDLLLAYRLADRMVDAVALWEAAVRRDDAPFWLRNAAADAYLALRRPAEAEPLYRSIADERPGTPEPWTGLYWAAIERRRYDDAEAALARLAEVPGQALTTEIRRGWLMLFSGRTRAGEAHFQALFERHPANASVRDGLATAHLWQGWTRQGLRGVEELLARTTLDMPRVDNPGGRITRAGALASLGELAEARRQAEDLARSYPENTHAQRLRRDVDTMLSPEARLEGRYDTSDRGLGETWSQLEVTVPVGTRARLAAGGHLSRSEDETHARGDVESAFLGLSARPARWLSASAEASFDLASEGPERTTSWSGRLVLLPDDHWRIELGAALDAWRDLPLRARAGGVVADTYDAGIALRTGGRWSLRGGAGLSELSDGNERRWGLAAAQLLGREGPVYRAHFGAEVYGSENERSDVAYFSPVRDRSASLTHRSEWITANASGRRHTVSLLLHAGGYEQEGFDLGLVGGVWLQSDWDLSGRTVLVLGAGARSQLYDGTRELDPRFWITARRRF